MPAPCAGLGQLVPSVGMGWRLGAPEGVRPQGRRDYLGPTLLLGHWQADIHPPRATQDCGQRGSHVDRREACPASGLQDSAQWPGTGSMRQEGLRAFRESHSVCWQGLLGLREA